MQEYLYTQSKCFMCFMLVTCPSLTSPTNGMISCSLGGNNIPNPGESCTFTCDASYELNGSGTRNCQNSGSWSGSDATCSRGKWFLILYITRLLCKSICILKVNVLCALC